MCASSPGEWKTLLSKNISIFERFPLFSRMFPQRLWNWSRIFFLFFSNRIYSARLPRLVFVTFSKLKIVSGKEKEFLKKRSIVIIWTYTQCFFFFEPIKCYKYITGSICIEKKNVTPLLISESYTGNNIINVQFVFRKFTNKVPCCNVHFSYRDFPVDHS